MKTVTFENAPSSWNEALPLGNGHFGGMVFFEDNKLTMALNHYEVYYQKLQCYSKKYRHEEGREFYLQYGLTFDELKQRANDMYQDPDQGPLFLYGDALSSRSMYRTYGKPSGGASHYPTGEIHLFPSEELAEPDSYSLGLDMEKAVVYLRIEKGEEKLGVSTIIAQDGDYVLTEIKQTNASLLKSLSLFVPSRRYVDMNVEYHQLDESTFYYKGSFYPDGEGKERFGPFSFIVMMKMIGAKGDVDVSDDAIRVHLRDAEHLALVCAIDMGLLSVQHGPSLYEREGISLI